MGQNLKYYTPRDVALHITLEDLWVSLFGKVLDLTPLCKANEGNEKLLPLLWFGGKDITHFFDDQGEVRSHLNPSSNKVDNFLPFREFLEVPPQEHVSSVYNQRKLNDEIFADCLVQRVNSHRLGKTDNNSNLPSWENGAAEDDVLPWWKDTKYVVGHLTRKPRWIRIRNTMIMKDVKLEVCVEETMEAILERYLRINCHARSYTWKYLAQELDMEQTLEDNGIPEIDADRLKLKEEDFIPIINLYFNDDLTEM